MSSILGKNIKVSIFGQSHGIGIGAVIDGLPSGIALCMEDITKEMARRSPGDNPWSTKRKEPDNPKIISGLYKGKTTGTPLCAIIENKDMKSSDYEEFENIPRPGHADYTGYVKYNGANDPTGGGHFSGRLTAPLVFAGAVCKQIYQKYFSINIYSHIYSIGNIKDKQFGVDINANNDTLRQMDFPVLDNFAGDAMKSLIQEISNSKDSIGGVIETAITGVPVGLGDPMFEGMESCLASAIFSIPAVKGVEFGAGFGSGCLKGSENNDEPYFLKNSDGTYLKKILFKTNNAGGILGGITNGMPIIIRTGIKPTSSISKEQKTVNLSTGENTLIKVKGRHDPCIVPRALPVVDAVCSIVLLDKFIGSGWICNNS